VTIQPFSPALPTDRTNRAGTVGGQTTGLYASDQNRLHAFAALVAAFLSGMNSGVPLSSLLAGKSDVGHGHTSSNISDFAEAVQDVLGSSIAAGTGIGVAYNDAANTFTISSTVAGGVTSVVVNTGAAGSSPSGSVAGTVLTLNIPAGSSGSGITSVVVNQTAAGSSPSGSVTGSVLTLNIPQAGGNSITGFRKQNVDGSWPARPSCSLCISEYRAGQTANPSDAFVDDLFIEARPAPVISAQPTGASVALNAAATLSVTVTGSVLSYQWQSSTTQNGTYTDISGAIASSYSAPTASSGTLWYRVVVTNPSGSATSTAVSVVVAGAAVAPSITGQPSGSTINSGTTATLSLTATGTSPLSYQWYVGTSGNTSSPISGATASSYTTPTLSSTTSYWCRVTNAAGTADSTTATVTVNAAAPALVLTPTVTPSSGDGLTSSTPWTITGSTTDFAFNVTATVGGSGATISALSVSALQFNGVDAYNVAVASEVAKQFRVVSGTPWTLGVLQGIFGGTWLVRLTATVNGQEVILDRYVATNIASLTWAATKLSDGSTLTTAGSSTTFPYIAANDTIVITATHGRYTITSLTYLNDLTVATPAGAFSSVGTALRVNTVRSAGLLNAGFRVGVALTTPHGSIVLREDQGVGGQVVRRAVRFEPAGSPALALGTPTGNFGGTGTGLSTSSPFGAGGGFGVAMSIPITSTSGTVVITSVLVAQSFNGGATFGSDSAGSGTGTAAAVLNLGTSDVMFRVTVAATAGGTTATPIVFYVQDVNNL
jgi:hypothetical protein